jgi:hypothetical protein
MEKIRYFLTNVTNIISDENYEKVSEYCVFEIKLPKPLSENNIDSTIIIKIIVKKEIPINILEVLYLRAIKINDSSLEYESNIHLVFSIENLLKNKIKILPYINFFLTINKIKNNYLNLILKQNENLTSNNNELNFNYCSEEELNIIRNIFGTENENNYLLKFLNIFGLEIKKINYVQNKQMIDQIRNNIKNEKSIIRNDSNSNIELGNITNVIRNINVIGEIVAIEKNERKNNNIKTYLIDITDYENSLTLKFTDYSRDNQKNILSEKIDELKKGN